MVVILPSWNGAAGESCGWGWAWVSVSVVGLGRWAVRSSVTGQAQHRYTDAGRGGTLA